MNITNKIIEEFEKTLVSAEKTAATAEQYARQVTAMREHIGGELTDITL